MAEHSITFKLSGIDTHKPVEWEMKLKYPHRPTVDELRTAFLEFLRQANYSVDDDFNEVKDCKLLD